MLSPASTRHQDVTDFLTGVLRMYEVDADIEADSDERLMKFCPQRQVEAYLGWYEELTGK